MCEELSESAAGGREPALDWAPCSALWSRFLRSAVLGIRLAACTIPDTASLPSTPDVFPTALVSRRSCVPHPSVTNSSGAGTLSLCLPRTPGGRLLAPWRSILPPSRWQEEQQQRKLHWLLLLQCRAIVREFSCKL